MVIIEFYLNILKIFYFLVTHRTGQISELSFVGSFYVKFVSVMELQYSMSAHKSSIKYVTVVMSKSTLYYVSFRLLCFATVQLLLIFNFLGEKFIHFTLQ